MKSEAISVEKYIDSLPIDRKEIIIKIRTAVLKNLPKGFYESMNGMIEYGVPLSIYPDGYRCNSKQPLPFMYIASQKNFVALYHMGIYADTNLLKWFTDKYFDIYKSKPDMGKSCIRFKKQDKIPYDLIGELVSKISVQDWITTYEKKYKK